jgi:hypothetical protein
MDLQEINTTPHLRALTASVVAVLLGPICCLCGGLTSRAYNQRVSFDQVSLTPFFLSGFLYGIVILVTLGLGIFGLIKSRQAAEPHKAIILSIIGLLLTLPSLGFLLLIWGSFLVLPCGIFGC